MNTKSLKEFCTDLSVWRAIGAWVVVGTLCVALSNSLTAALVRLGPVL